MVLKKELYLLPTSTLAKELLGCLLIHTINGRKIGGRIVETESYLSKNDPACHAHKGMSKRNKTMFEAPGISYLYLIYGMYHCFNVVSAREGCGEAVLVRALEPLFGLDFMRKQRKKEDLGALCSGPGKLCQALGLSLAENGLCLRQSKVRIYDHASFAKELGSAGRFDKERRKIVKSTRIGISKGKELPLRFLLKDSTFVSHPA